MSEPACSKSVVSVWIITVGEPLPVDGQEVRLYRSGILSHLMAKEGHQVTWWSSSFNHTQRKQREIEDTDIQIEPNLSLYLIESPGYKTAVSASRLISHIVTAWRFYRVARTTKRPDVILVSYPTIELSLAALRLGRKFNAPVVADVRDLWPDIFVDVFPSRLKGLGRLLLFPYEWAAGKVFRQADSIVAITEGFLDWGLTKGGRPKNDSDAVFPMAYAISAWSEDEEISAREFWAKHDVTEFGWNICYFGTLGRQSNFESVIETARLIEKKFPAVRFVICGTGDKDQLYKEKSGGLTNVILPGWVNRFQIQSLMRMSKCALVNYPAISNYLLNVPNKPIEYMSAGLPILSNIDGVLGRLIDEHNIGAVYVDSDPSDLAKKIADLIDDSELRKKMSESSKRLFELRYNADVIYPEFSKHLVTIGESKGADSDARVQK